jgi:hypothetical protein
MPNRSNDKPVGGKKRRPKKTVADFACIATTLQPLLLNIATLYCLTLQPYCNKKRPN